MSATVSAPPPPPIIKPETVKLEEASQAAVAETPTLQPRPAQAKKAPPKAEPKDEVRKADATKADTRKGDVQKAEAKKADSPKAEVEKANAKKADTRKGDVRKAEAEKADAKKADTKKGDVQAAKAEKADTGASKGETAPTKGVKAEEQKFASLVQGAAEKAAVGKPSVPPVTAKPEVPKPAQSAAQQAVPAQPNPARPVTTPLEQQKAANDVMRKFNERGTLSAEEAEHLRQLAVDSRGNADNVKKWREISTTMKNTKTELEKDLKVYKQEYDSNTNTATILNGVKAGATGAAQIAIGVGEMIPGSSVVAKNLGFAFDTAEFSREVYDGWQDGQMPSAAKVTDMAMTTADKAMETWAPGKPHKISQLITGPVGAGTKIAGLQDEQAKTGADRPSNAALGFQAAETAASLGATTLSTAGTVGSLVDNSQEVASAARGAAAAAYASGADNMAELGARAARLTTDAESAQRMLNVTDATANVFSGGARVINGVGRWSTGIEQHQQIKADEKAFNQVVDGNRKMADQIGVKSAYYANRAEMNECLQNAACRAWLESQGVTVSPNDAGRLSLP